MLEVIPIQSLGIAENGSRFLERDAVLSQVADGFASVPREHINVYTLIRRWCQIGFARSRNQDRTEIIFLNG